MLLSRSSVAFAVPLIGGCAHHYERWEPTLRDEAVAQQLLEAPQLQIGRLTGQSIQRRGPAGFYDRIKIRAAEPVGAGDLGSPDPIVVGCQNAQRIEILYGEERRAIAAATAWPGAARDRRCLAGLALSGGGVRSAAFAAGVLDALHECNLLGAFGYLSSVSGGGIAAATYMSNRDYPADGSPEQRRLAQYGRYLVRGHYSKSFGEVVCRVLRWPVDWVMAAFVNELPFHWQRNTPAVRDVYRSAIAEACLTPSTDRDAPTSMRRFLPAAGSNRPFWIVNAHLSLNYEDAAGARNRSGDAFEITPQRAGADSVGYVRVQARADGDTFWTAPDYALAASAAALDSSSLQFGRLGSFALYALNFDLGYWIPAWGYGWVVGDPGVWRHNAFYVAKSVWPISWVRWLAQSAFRDHNFTTDGRRYAITDGGHFDNLGIYALIRRGCRLIVASDASEDPAVNAWNDLDESTRQRRTFADLRRLEARIAADFGATVTFAWERFDPTRPCAANKNGDAPASVLVGTIRNLPLAVDGKPLDLVTIILIKAAYPSGQRRRSAGYLDQAKAVDGSFPHTSTLHQGFSEEQVVAYRRLGRELARSVADKIQAELCRIGAVDSAAAGPERR